MQLKGWRLHLLWRLRGPSWCSIAVYFRNSKSKRLVCWVLGLWLVWSECYCIMQSLDKGHPCVFQVNFCLWMLLNVTFPSKYFQGGDKRMLSSYVVNSYQATFTAGKSSKWRVSRLVPSSLCISLGFLKIKWCVIFRGQFGIHKSEPCLPFDLAIPFLGIYTKEILVSPDFSQMAKQQRLVKHVRTMISEKKKAVYKMIPFSAVWYNPIVNVLFALSKYSTVNI